MSKDIIKSSGERRGCSCCAFLLKLKHEEPCIRCDVTKVTYS